MKVEQFRPVLRPLLPRVDRVAQYLRRADDARWYTNFGQLALELERRISDLLCYADPVVVSTNSGTSALEAAILATAGRARPDRALALMPAYTFAATALAVERCGYRPHFLDVDPETWALDPISVTRHRLLPSAGVIVPVAPYGRAPDVDAWEVVREETGVPVVIDAAAAFEALCDDPDLVSPTVPLAVSFHSTKTFSTGEGGGVFWSDDAGQQRVRQATNFGFHGGRESLAPGFNGKMSEYHAAVGLASLDEWADRRQAYADVADAFRDAADAFGIVPNLFVAPTIGSAYALFSAETATAAGGINQRLRRAGFEWRRWYGLGIHTHPHFTQYASDPAPVTEHLGATLVGLPTAADLDPNEAQRIIAAVGRLGATGSTVARSTPVSIDSTRAQAQ